MGPTCIQGLTTGSHDLRARVGDGTLVLFPLVSGRPPRRSISTWVSSGISPDILGDGVYMYQGTCMYNSTRCSSGYMCGCRVCTVTYNVRVFYVYYT